MPEMTNEQSRQIKVIIRQVKALITTIESILSNKDAQEIGRYTSFRNMAESYNDLAKAYARTQPEPVMLKMFDIKDGLNQMNTLWTQQKEALEEVLIQSKFLLAIIEGDVDFADDAFDDFADFVALRFRAMIFDTPSAEKEVQNMFEALLVGRGMDKGTDYDRESGKVEYSGKEYIPDFVLMNPKMAVEIKLMKEERQKSKVIEEISADITAYSKEYERILFVVYDLGCIQNVVQFKGDIEKSGNIRVIVVKH